MTSVYLLSGRSKTLDNLLIRIVCVAQTVPKFPLDMSVIVFLHSSLRPRVASVMLLSLYVSFVFVSFEFIFYVLFSLFSFS